MFFLFLLKGGTPFTLVFKDRPIPESELLYVEFGTGNVVKAGLTPASNEIWYGSTPRKCLISVEIIRYVPLGKVTIIEEINWPLKKLGLLLKV